MIGYTMLQEKLQIHTDTSIEEVTEIDPEIDWSDLIPGDFDDEEDTMESAESVGSAESAQPDDTWWAQLQAGERL